MVYEKIVNVKTTQRTQIINITSQIDDVVAESGVKEGLCYIGSLHTTAGIIVNDNESGLHTDMLSLLEKIVPYDPSKYLHNRIGEDNADAHLKLMLIGMSETLAISAGKLVLGTWQRIFFVELDGPRQRRVVVKIIGE